MKRQINSEAELVNALCKGIKVEKLVRGVYTKFCEIWVLLSPLKKDIENRKFRYSETVEVVELINTLTHKQIQIHQNGEIIWTETIKIK